MEKCNKCEKKPIKDLLKENCKNCGKRINRKKEYHCLLYHRETAEETPKSFEVEVAYAEPLGYFCTSKCFKEFLHKHKIKRRD